MKKSTEDFQAPEGGWGWIAAFGASMTFTFTIGPFAAFALIYKNKIESFGDGTQAMTLLASVNTSFSNLIGVVTNFAITKFSCRQVGIVGSLIFFFSSFWCAFCNSTLELVLAFGVFQGIGMGLMFPAAFTTISHYFIRKRTFVMGLTQLMTGIWCTILPKIVQSIFDEYGFFGTQLIISSMSLHTLLSAIMQQPVHMHLKKKKKKTAESMPVLEQHEQSRTIDFISEELQSKEEGDQKSIQAPNTNSESTIFNILRRCWFALVELMDLTLLLDPKYVNIAMGMAFSFFADIANSTLMTLVILDLGYSNEDTAIFLSTNAAADIAGRLSITLIGAVAPTISSRIIAFFGIVAAIISRIIFASVKEFLPLITFVGLMGFFRGYIHIPIPLVFAEYNLKRFPAAIGLYMVMSGIICLIAGPFVGWVRDVTNSYPMSLYTLSALHIIFTVIPWCVEFIFNKNCIYVNKM